MSRIYLDHAAATPLDPAVRRAMVRASMAVGNPSSYNDAGRAMGKLLEDARIIVARFLNARPEEIVFTSSGSEANTLAIKGILTKQDGDVLTTPIEHKSVLENMPTDARFISVDLQGRIDLKDFEKKLTKKTVLVSVMYANNEIGTIQPIAKLARIISAFRKKRRTSLPLLHVDACQATEYLPMNVQNLGVDLLSFNGSKVYGPTGTGVLFVRRGVKIAPLITGGGQEHGLRAGTENVSAVVGLARALMRVHKKEETRAASLRDYFFGKISIILPEAKVNGARGTERLANNINISIPGLESENLLLELDKHGISAGSGSACTARSVEPSHVLKAIGVKKPYLDGALRFSLGRSTTKKEIDQLLKILPMVVADLKKRYG